MCYHQQFKQNKKSEAEVFNINIKWLLRLPLRAFIMLHHSKNRQHHLHWWEAVCTPSRLKSTMTFTHTNLEITVWRSEGNLMCQCLRLQKKKKTKARGNSLKYGGEFPEILWSDINYKQHNRICHSGMGCELWMAERSKCEWCSCGVTYCCLQDSSHFNFKPVTAILGVVVTQVLVKHCS